MRCVPGYYQSVFYHKNALIKPCYVLSGQYDADYTIIGLGVAGLAAARQIVSQTGGTSARIIGLEAGVIGGQSAGGRNGGQILRTFGEHFLPDVADRHGKEFSDILLRRSHGVIRQIKQMAQADSTSGWQAGAATLAMDEDQKQQLEEVYQYFLSVGEPSKLIVNPAELPFGNVCAALVDPVAGCVDPYRLLQREAADFTNRGGQIFEKSPVTDIAIDGDSFIVQTEQGLVRSRHVILTAGPGLTHIIEKLPTIKTVKDRVLSSGTMIMVTEPLPDAITQPFRQAGAYHGYSEPCDYFHLNAENRLNFGSTGFMEGTAIPSLDLLVEKTRGYSEDLYRGIRGRKFGISHFWHGYETITAQLEPIVRQDFVGDNQSIKVLGGGNGAGNVAMRVAGQWAAQNIEARLTHGQSIEGFDQFCQMSPRKFPGCYMASSLMAAFMWTQETAGQTPLKPAADFVRHNVFKL
jgi:glycine/D-amino acid oxidase-like deaminating enzyme